MAQQDDDEMIQVAVTTTKTKKNKAGNKKKKKKRKTKKKERGSFKETDDPSAQQQRREEESLAHTVRNDHSEKEDEEMGDPNATTKKKKSPRTKTIRNHPTTNNMIGLAVAKNQYQRDSILGAAPEVSSPSTSVGRSTVTTGAATTTTPSSFALTRPPGAYRVQVFRDHDDNDGSSVFSEEQDPSPSYVGTAEVERWDGHDAHNDDDDDDQEQPQQQQQQQSFQKPRQSALLDGSSSTTTMAVIIVIFLMIVGAVVVVIVAVRVPNNRSQGNGAINTDEDDVDDGIIDLSNTDILASGSTIDLNSFPYLSLFALQYGFDRSDCPADRVQSFSGLANLTLTCSNHDAQGIVILDNDGTVGHLRYTGHELTDTSDLKLICDRRSSTEGACRFGFNTVVVESVVLIVACVSNNNTMEGSGLILESTLPKTSEIPCTATLGSSAAYISHSLSVGQFCYGRNMEFEPAPQCLEGLEGTTDTGNLDIPFCGQWDSCTSGNHNNNTQECTMETAGSLSVTSPSEDDACSVGNNDDATVYASLYNTSSLWEELQHKLVIPRFAINAHKVLISDGG